MRVTRRVFQLGGLAVASAALSPEALARLDTHRPVRNYRQALVIGNAEYHEFPCTSRSNRCSLNSPANDAMAVARMLERAGFATALEVDARAVNLDKAINRFVRESYISEFSFFYYSGHAIQVGGENYIIPVDASPSSITMDDSLSALVKLSTFARAAARADAVGVLVLDACRDNPTLINARAVLSKKYLTGPGLAEVSPRRHYLVAYATAPGAVAYDGKRGGLSPYTSVLVRELSKPTLRLLDAFHKIQTSVCDITSSSRHDGCQQPYISTNIGVEPIYLHRDADLLEPINENQILGNIRTADPADPFNDPPESEAWVFREPYVLKFQDTESLLPSIVPGWDYFTSKYKDGTAFFEANDHPIVSMSEGRGTWGLSYPVLDLICRRISPGQVKLGRLVVEARNGRPDTAPYASLHTPANPFMLNIINESISNSVNCRLSFNIYGYEDYNLGDIKKLIELQSRSEKAFQYETGVITVSTVASLDVCNLIQDGWPDAKYLRWMDSVSLENVDSQMSAWREIVNEDGHVTRKELVPFIEGFEDWYKENMRFEERTSAPTLSIYGSIASSDPSSGEEVIAQFVANLSVLSVGRGGNAIEYDNRFDFVLRTDGSKQRYERALASTLRSSKETFRSLVRLGAAMSSYHDVNVSLYDENNVELYSSGWMLCHIVLSGTLSSRDRN